MQKKKTENVVFSTIFGEGVPSFKPKKKKKRFQREKVIPLYIVARVVYSKIGIWVEKRYRDPQARSPRNERVRRLPYRTVRFAAYRGPKF